MAASVRIAVQGADRVGLVAVVTGCLFSFGLDLGDTTFGVLGAGFEFAAVAECPSGVSAAQVEAELRLLPDLADCQITVRNFAFNAPPGDRGGGTRLFCDAPVEQLDNGDDAVLKVFDRQAQNERVVLSGVS